MSDQPITPILRAEIFWIDVNDHLPDDEMTVLIWTKDPEVEMGYHFDGRWWFANRLARDTSVAEVTHWADLPEGPKP